MESKKKLLVSFSGGETSAFMAQWLWRNKQDEFDMIFVFANTGQENLETLQFVRNCEKLFGFPVVWVEAVVYPNERKGTSFKQVEFLTADIDGSPFHEVIKKYGIPNINSPHCTRELKQNPIRSYAKSIGWKDYYLAIGIREDEIDRQNKKAEKLRFIYPLISMQPMTKKKINFFWKQQPFRLDLKGYQGNCITCWKKSDAKLYTIANERPKDFIFMSKMESRYSDYTSESKLIIMKEKGKAPKYPIYFFRGNRSAIQICHEAKSFNKSIINDSDQYDLHNESCEVFSECSDT